MSPQDPPRAVHELFLAQAERTPDALAVVDTQGSLTYAELRDASGDLARFLCSRGVGRDRSVGVMMEKSVDYIVACMAALRAGGAYLPLDTAYPDSMLTRILEQTRSPVVLTRKALAPRLEGTRAGCVLALDGDENWRDDLPGDPLPEVAPEDLAYIVYTSGTTGEPKGIEAPHRGSLHSYGERHRFQPYLPGQRVACNIFFCWEFFRPLARGATVYVIPDQVIYDPRPLVAFLEEHRITEVLFTPSLLETVFQTVPEERLREALESLEVVYLNGEVVTGRLRERALDVLPGSTKLLNTYSISECHDVANLDLRRAEVPASGFCPVGFPIDGIQVRLLDGDLRPAPEGEPGELFVGGPGLARGYLQRPDLTAARFVEVDGERYYRTGDVAFRHPDGLLEIRGRCDFMVKIRGYSVHLGAVEASLRKLPGVTSAAVVTEGAEGEDKRLVAYVTRASGGDWTVDPETGVCADLRRGLEPLLADFMIPSVYVEIDQLPLSPTTGKLDTDRLPPPPRRQDLSSADLSLPEGASESARREVMRALWARVLGLAPRDLRDDSDFFDLGGHSLLAVQLTVAVDQVFGAELTVQQVYEYPTVASLVRFLGGPPSSSPERRVPRPAPLRADAHLPEDIVPAGPADCDRVQDAGVVFLTGTTGFLGAFLLDELLRETSAELRCLVRARDEADARSRIARTQERFGLDAGERLSRIRPVVGDLARPRFGLDAEVFQALADEVDFVFHCAALVNYVFPYAKLKGPTVHGTQEVLRLACTGRVAPVVHVSTNGIVPEGAGLRVEENRDIDAFVDLLAGGYGQAKWVAEKLVWEAAERGLPVSVFRPGNIGHHSVSGAANPSDLQYILLEACLDLRFTPRKPEWAVELTPVDHLVRALVRFARDPVHQGEVYNVIGSPPLPLSTISATLRDLGALDGRERLGPWSARLRQAARERAHPGMEMLSRTLGDLDRALTHGNHFVCENFHAAARRAEVPLPVTDAAYLRSFLHRREAQRRQG